MILMGKYRLQLCHSMNDSIKYSLMYTAFIGIVFSATNIVFSHSSSWMAYATLNAWWSGLYFSRFFSLEPKVALIVFGISLCLLMILAFLGLSSHHVNILSVRAGFFLLLQALIMTSPIVCNVIICSLLRHKLP